MIDIIAVSGIDGAGKTTACTYIYDKLILDCIVKQGNLYYYIEPSKSNAGFLALDMIRSHEYNNMELTLLLLADRLHHIDEIKKLGNNIVVILDRFMLCTMAYQGIVQDGCKEVIYTVHQKIVDDIGKEHIHNILLDVEPIVAFNRMVSERRRLDAMETRGEEFFNKVREAYIREICNPMFQSGHIVNCNQGLTAVKMYIDDIIKDIFKVKE